MGTLVFLKNSFWMHHEEWAQVPQTVKHRIAMERERKNEERLAQSCPTLCDPMDCTVHQSLWDRILEYFQYFPSPGDLPNPGIEPRSPTLQADSSPAEPQGKSKNTGVCSLSLLQGIILTQEWNRGLPQCRQIAI